MPKVLRLYNTFTKTIDEVRLAGKLIEPKHDSLDVTSGSFYICGPTVYSESHLGHALTYARADLFRRFMKSIFNVRLSTVMNITDVDDKILAKVQQESPEAWQDATKDPAEHPFNRLSEKYYKSFLDDMKYIRVNPPDITVKVSRHVTAIAKYISQLEKKGHAYITPQGDVYFHTPSVNNYIGRMREDVEMKVSPDKYKKDARDFVLWKAAKLGEPVWNYLSDVTKQNLPGRPGWHVQCSAIASSIFGKQLDFHFGGSDLIFPHHYNEEACCCAYHELDTSKSMHVWSNYWMHSGHLVLKDSKMSKSLGNVLAIRSFINESSINALRLLCISTHYRSNVEFNRALMDSLGSIDHRLSAFVSRLSDGLRSIRDEGLKVEDTQDDVTDIQVHLQKTQENIVDGVCDEFDLSQGLDSILDLSKIIYNIGTHNMNPRDLVATWQLVDDWCNICGLEYGPMNSAFDETLVQLIRDFRQTVRTSTVDELKRLNRESSNDSSKTEYSYTQVLNSILKECDDVRSRLDELGFVERDNKTKP